MVEKTAANGTIPKPSVPERKMTSEYTSKSPEFRKRRQSSKASNAIFDLDTSLSELWAGLALAHTDGDDEHISIGCSLHDGTYPIDFSISTVELNERMTRREGQKMIEDYIILDLKMYQKDHLSKVLGVGVTADLDRAAPQLCSRLWSELDIVPMVFEADTLAASQGKKAGVDEIADSVARKCISLFGPLKQPRLAISYRNEVQVDTNGRAKLTTRADYEKTVRPPTWRTVNKLIKEVKDKNIRFAYFSATPQGGGVALMRHALLRFLRDFGVKAEWYVPRPRPDVFRITKTNHNIFQGVVPPDTRVTAEQLEKISSWVRDNANKYWLAENGPLRPASKGGADVIVCDDPQMPEIIKISKEQDPDRPVIFRSHIEVRDDLIEQEGSAAQFLWNSMWENIRRADVFIAHPVKSFVPKDVKPEILGWLPATTDWLDGLNKKMTGLELQYYMRILKHDCQVQKLASLSYPDRPYITQIARFDPSKGIPDVIKSYAKLMKLMNDKPLSSKPQLIVCGHGSVDDPDGAIVYDETMSLIENEFSYLSDDIVVIRIGPSDQILNAIISLSKVVLQLSLREGFEVKVSEALHKGKPVIATRTGGIPLQIQEGKSGFIVERGDTSAVAKHLYDLFTDNELYHEMSRFAKDNVSDEVHTVGNAVAWLWLVKSMHERRGEGVLKLNSKWVNDLAREEAGETYKDGEPRLPRHLST